MARKFYIQTRLYNVNDRLASLYLCENVDRIIDQKQLTNFEHCYLPYRDSDKQISGDVPDVGKAIFEQDVKTLKACSGIIGNYDGVGYDSGCGFEIGLSYAYGYPINLISTDFMKWGMTRGDLEIKYYTGSAFLQYVANIISIIEDDPSITDYRTQQESLRDQNVQALIDQLIQDFHVEKPPVPLERSPQQFDLFIDPGFSDTQSGNQMANTLTSQLLEKKITFSRGNNQMPEMCIDKLRACSVALFSGDTFEHDLDSCILQGIAYGLGIPIIMYSSNRHRYNDGRMIGQKNVMITQSATKMIDKIEDVISTYQEIVNK